MSEALAFGFRLHGSPAATFNGEHVVVAEAIVWPGPETGPPHEVHASDRN